MLTEHVPIYRETVNPLKKKRIAEPLDLGIRAFNGLLTCGRGQRMGIFAGIRCWQERAARDDRATYRGERKRDRLDRRARQRGAGVSRTGPGRRPQPLCRDCCYLGSTSAHSGEGRFPDSRHSRVLQGQGRDVLLLMDSLTRFAMAQREVGLAIGEPPTTKGYTPSVFSHLTKLLERTGNGEGTGTMTAIFSVLVEGDDLDDPIADASRAVLDGHVVLSRKLADSNQYPAIDVLRSVSRTMKDIVATGTAPVCEQDNRNTFGIRTGRGSDQHRGIQPRQ